MKHDPRARRKFPEKMNTITVSRKTRALGWAYETQGTGRGTEIKVPAAPMYEGTIRQIFNQVDSDKNFQSIRKNCYYKIRWFYKGKPIIKTANNYWGLLYPYNIEGVMEDIFDGLAPNYVTFEVADEA